MSNEKSLDLYHDEVTELLQTMEKNLINLEKNPGSYELIDDIFRVLHTIKGSGSMFGLDRIAGFTHEVETIFDLIRKKIIPINREIISLALKAGDHIGYLLDNPDAPVTVDEKSILNSFKNIHGEPAVAQKKKEPPGIQNEEKELKVFRINFRPEREILLRGTSIYPLFNELAGLGEMLVIPVYDEIPDIQSIDPELCYLSWTIILTTGKTVNDIKDVFIFVEDYCELDIEQIYYTQDETEVNYKKIGEILLENGKITEPQINEILNDGRKFGRIAVDKGFVSEDAIETALDEQKEFKKAIKTKKDHDETSTIRVKYRKLDDLVNYIGELVTLEAQISDYSRKNYNQDLNLLTESLGRLTSVLRDNAMELRMIPIEETFSGIYRLVRDLSKSLGKEVSLLTSGGETELDKTIIDELKDPLIHIVRNAIDHGIEPPDIRKKSGKPSTGTITISVFNEGSNVVIRISDDGAGLDKEKIRLKALETGLINPADIMTEKETINLVFLPGFSTAAKTTEISGRGVGMDIVKRNIENLRGTIGIESGKNEGTTIIIKIPLTLAIIDGLLMNIGDEKYILNLSLISECLDFTNDTDEKTGGRNIINLRGDTVPFISLRNIFGIGGGRPEIQQMVIINIENKKIGLIVDNIIGQHKVVLKSIGRVFNKMDEISGATILGDGTIALVLDANKIYNRQIK